MNPHRDYRDPFTGVGADFSYGQAQYLEAATAEAHDPLVTAAPKLLAALANRLGFDELYAATFGRLNALLAAVAAGLDRWVFGVLIKFLGQFSLFSGSINREIDEDGLNGGFDLVSASVRGTGQRYSRAQSGSTVTISAPTRVNIRNFTAFSVDDIRNVYESESTVKSLSIEPNRYVQFSDVWLGGASMGTRAVVGTLQQALVEADQALLDARAAFATDRDREDSE